MLRVTLLFRQNCDDKPGIRLQFKRLIQNDSIAIKMGTQGYSTHCCFSLSASLTFMPLLNIIYNASTLALRPRWPSRLWGWRAAPGLGFRRPGRGRYACALALRHEPFHFVPRI